MLGDLFNDELGPKLIEREGGSKFTNDPADRGGPTKWGVTAKQLGAWRKLGRDATASEVRFIPFEEALAIFRQEFWIVPGFDKIADVSAIIAEELFDSAVNLGPSWPSRWLQRSLNLANQGGKTFPDLKVDGQLGATTAGALAAFLRARPADGTKIVLTCLNGFQFGRYVDITEAGGPNGDQERFFCGWVAGRVGFAA